MENSLIRCTYIVSLSVCSSAWATVFGTVNIRRIPHFIQFCRIRSRATSTFWMPSTTTVSNGIGISGLILGRKLDMAISDGSDVSPRPSCQILRAACVRMSSVVLAPCTSINVAVRLASTHSSKYLPSCHVLPAPLSPVISNTGFPFGQHGTSRTSFSCRYPIRLKRSRLNLAIVSGSTLRLRSRSILRPASRSKPSRSVDFSCIFPSLNLPIRRLTKRSRTLRSS